MLSHRDVLQVVVPLILQRSRRRCRPLTILNMNDHSPAATGLTLLCGLKFFSLRIMRVQATNLKNHLTGSLSALSNLK